jgi:pyruvate,water dikinase
VVTDVATARIEPGEVLVARATDPSWTPLFLTAGALIVEEGGPLSHAAIVARELGLPAVLNVPGITTALSTGTEVTVDGTRGEILIHAEAERSVA